MKIVKNICKGIDAAANGSPGISLIAKSSLILAMLFLLIHVITVGVAFARQGIMATLGTLVFPVLAQFYWFFQSWDQAQTPVNWYCMLLVFFGLCVFVIGILFRVVVKSGMCGNLEELKRKNQELKRKKNGADDDTTCTYC